MVKEKLWIEQPYDLIIPDLGIYSQNPKVILNDICVPMFISVLITIAKTGNNPDVQELFNDK